MPHDGEPISVIEIFTDGPEVVEIYTEPLAVLDVQTRGPQGPAGPPGPPGDVLYTNLNPVPNTLGGITAGSTFENASVQEMFDRLLYPYQMPSFSSFTIVGQSSLVEVGETIGDEGLTFSWNASNLSNVEPNSVSIWDGSTQLVGGLSGSGTQFVAIDPVTRTTPGPKTYTIRGLNTNGDQFQRNVTVSWVWNLYFGTSVNTTLDESEIESLAGKQLSSSAMITYSFAAGGYKFICYPTNLVPAYQIIDVGTNFDVTMADPSDHSSFNNVFNDYYYATISITNTYGLTTDYRVYRTKYTLGGSIQIKLS